ncbi:MAG: 50S ribosomal protein L6 [Elusimicrobiota bacterium]
MPINIPDGVNVDISGQDITVESSGKKLTHKLHDGITLTNNAGRLMVGIDTDTVKLRGLHGLSRTLINNMVIGVKDGFKKRLEIIGRGKKANVQGKSIILELGFSHPVDFHLPEGIEVNVAKNIIEITGIDKQKVGEVAAELRDLQSPEPYKGAGIRYEGEVIKKKAGKTAIGGGFTGSGK